MSFPAIIVFGDSITEKSFSPAGFGTSLSQAYVRRADVLNRGLSGYNSIWLLQFLEKILTAQVSEVLLFIIMVGANDAVLPGFVHHVNLPTFAMNLKRMISLIHDSSASPTKNSKVLLVSPPPIDAQLLKKLGPRGGSDREEGNTRKYVEMVKTVSQDLIEERQREGGGKKIAFLDFHEVVREDAKEKERERGSESDYAEYLEDGLHLSEDGYRLLYKAIMQRLGEVWPEVLPENLPMMAPWWGDLEDVRTFNDNAKAVKHSEL